MRERRTWWLSGVIITALLVGIIAKSGIWSKDAEASILFDGTADNLCMGSVCLVREENGWWVEGEQRIPADETRVEELVRKLKEIRLEEKVSDNEARLEEFGLKDGLKVKTMGKEIEVGTVVENGSGTYVMVAGDKQVYKVAVVIDRETIGQMESWKVRRLASIPLMQIKKITRDGKEVGNDNLITKLANLEVGKYLPNFDQEKSVKYTFEIEVENDKKTIVVGKKRNIMWATVGDGLYFEISKADFNLLTARRI